VDGVIQKKHGFKVCIDKSLFEVVGDAVYVRHRDIFKLLVAKSEEGDNYLVDKIVSIIHGRAMAASRGERPYCGIFDHLLQDHFVGSSRFYKLEYLAEKKYKATMAKIAPKLSVQASVAVQESIAHEGRSDNPSGRSATYLITGPGPDFLLKQPKTFPCNWMKKLPY
jgi:hypothetical protein